MSWFIAVTNPNCHRRAEAGLAAIGYQSFYPRLRKWVSHARTKVAKEYPILGRYVFVEIPDGEFYAVRAVNGIEGLLTGDNGAPASIPREIVWHFRERYMAGEWDYVRNVPMEYSDENGNTCSSTFPPGALIRIMEGEFADLLTVVRGRGNGKIKFLPSGKNQFYFTREANVRAA